VPDTLGNGAIVGPASVGPTWLAAAVHAVETDDRMRDDVVQAGLAQVGLLADRGDVWGYLEWLWEHL